MRNKNKVLVENGLFVINANGQDKNTSKDNDFVFMTNFEISGTKKVLK